MKGNGDHWMQTVIRRHVPEECGKVMRTTGLLTDMSGDIHWKVSRLNIPAVYSGDTVRSEG